jgi:uncharacterized OB-fold protein
MENPRYWRNQKQFYTLIGNICLYCQNKIFPIRDVCPYCGKYQELYFIKEYNMIEYEKLLISADKQINKIGVYLSCDL